MRGFLLVVVTVAAAACGETTSVDGVDALDASQMDPQPIDAAVERDAMVARDASVVRDAAMLPDSGKEEDAGPPFVFTYADLNHALGTGQSLSVGAAGTPSLSLTQPYANLMFNGGVRPRSNQMTSFVPLVEGPTLETHSSAFANAVTSLAETVVFQGKSPPLNSHRMLVSIHGVGGTAYSGLKKGTAPFAAGIAQVTAAKSLAMGLGQSYMVRAITNVHGESDHIAQNVNYKQNLLEWQKDYDADIRAITGQTVHVPMLQTQMSSWTKYGQATSVIPGAQLDASIESKGEVVLVGPKYALPYADGAHLTNEGYRQLGEYYAKVYRHVVLEGKPWEPLRPLRMVLAGDEITISFHVPSPPLVLDSTSVVDPGNFGFEYSDDGGAAMPSITQVTIVSPNTVKLKLSAAPTAQNRHVRYAWTGTPGALGGATTGARGNLRDSDAAVSRYAYKLYNWCVHFDMSL